MKRFALFTLMLAAGLAGLGELGRAATTQPSATQPVTQPTTAPAHSTWYAVANPLPSADGSISRPLRVDHALALAKPGDTVLVHSGDVCDTKIGVKGKNGVTLSIYGGTEQATVAVPAAWGDAATWMLCDGWHVSGIHFTQTGRDPSKPDFKAQPGSNCLHLIQCNDWTFDGCTFDFGQNDVSLEGNSVRAPTFTRCVFGRSYAIAKPGESLPHSQGAFRSGQVGGGFVDCLFDGCGWCPIYQPANFFDHGIYNQIAAGGGSYLALRCKFLHCSNAGPTGEAGAVIDSCEFIDCNQDGSAYNAWVRNGVIRNSVSVGAGIMTDGHQSELAGNVVVAPSGFGVAVDKPNGDVSKDGDAVNVHDNTVLMAPNPAIAVTVFRGGSIGVTLANNHASK